MYVQNIVLHNWKILERKNKALFNRYSNSTSHQKFALGIITPRKKSTHPSINKLSNKQKASFKKLISIWRHNKNRSKTRKRVHKNAQKKNRKQGQNELEKKVQIPIANKETKKMIQGQKKRKGGNEEAKRLAEVDDIVFKIRKYNQRTQLEVKNELEQILDAYNAKKNLNEYVDSVNALQKKIIDDSRRI